MIRGKRIEKALFLLIDSLIIVENKVQLGLISSKSVFQG